MSGETNSGIRIRRLLAEGVMVVASILVAFALDAWWEERQLEQEILEDLAIVEAELAENIRLTRVTMGMMEKVVDNANAIVEQMFEEKGVDRIEVTGNQVLWGMLFNPTLDLSLGAIDAWIAAGRLAGISNPELRKRLASVRGKVADVTEEQQIARQIGTRDLTPQLAETTDDIRFITQSFTAGSQSRQATGIIEEPEMASLVLPNTPSMRLTFQIRTVWYVSSLVETQDFLTEMEEIQALLLQELGR